MRLHLESGLTVAEASRSLGLDQKSLYRKKEDVLKRLRSALEAEGIGPEAARELSRTSTGTRPSLQDVVQLRKKPGRVRLKGMTRPPAGKVSRETRVGKRA